MPLVTTMSFAPSRSRSVISALQLQSVRDTPAICPTSLNVPSRLFRCSMLRMAW